MKVFNGGYITITDMDLVIFTIEHLRFKRYPLSQ